MLQPGPIIAGMLREMGYVLAIDLGDDGSAIVSAVHQTTGQSYVAEVDKDYTGCRALMQVAEMVGFEIGERKRAMRKCVGLRRGERTHAPSVFLAPHVTPHVTKTDTKIRPASHECHELHKSIQNRHLR